MKVETLREIIALKITKEVFKRPVIDRDDLKRIVVNELKKIREYDNNSK